MNQKGQIPPLQKKKKYIFVMLTKEERENMSSSKSMKEIKHLKLRRKKLPSGWIYSLNLGKGKPGTVAHAPSPSPAFHKLKSHKGSLETLLQNQTKMKRAKDMGQ